MARCKKSSHIKKFFFKGQHTSAKHCRMAVPFLTRIPWALFAWAVCQKSPSPLSRQKSLVLKKTVKVFQNPYPNFKFQRLADKDFRLVSGCFLMLYNLGSHNHTHQFLNMHWLFGLWRVSRDLDKHSYYPVYTHPCVLALAAGGGVSFRAQK